MVLEKEGQRRSSSLSEARSNAAVKASKQRDGKKERETSETTTARRRRRRRREEEEDIIIIIIIIIALLGFPWLPQRETHGRRRIQSARESEIPRGRVERFVRLVQLRERVARTVRRETTRGVVGFVRDEESTEGIIVVRVFLSSVVGGGHTKQQKHL